MLRWGAWPSRVPVTCGLGSRLSPEPAAPQSQTQGLNEKQQLPSPTPSRSPVHIQLGHTGPRLPPRLVPPCPVTPLSAQLHKVVAHVISSTPLGSRLSPGHRRLPRPHGHPTCPLLLAILALLRATEGLPLANPSHVSVLRCPTTATGDPQSPSAPRAPGVWFLLCVVTPAAALTQVQPTQEVTRAMAPGGCPESGPHRTHPPPRRPHTRADGSLTDHRPCD